MVLSVLLKNLHFSWEEMESNCTLSHQSVRSMVKNIVQRSGHMVKFRS